MRWQYGADDLDSQAGAGTLASDADRDSAAGLLSEAFAEGRLTADEHGQRARGVYAARTWAELARLTEDLPVPADGGAGHPAALPGGMDWCLLCALLVLCPPAGIAWLLAACRRSRPGRGQPLVLGQSVGWAGQPARGQAADAPRPRAATAVPDRAGRPVMPGAGGVSRGPWGLHAEDR